MSETKYLNFEMITMDVEILKEEIKKEIKKGTPDEAYIKEILTYGAWGNEIYNLFFILVESGYAKGVKNLLEIRHDFDPNIQNADGMTALHWASDKNHLQVVQVLLNHPQIDPNLQTNRFGDTALHWASINGYSQAVQALLKHPSTDPNIQNSNGFTALHLASYWEHSHALQVLLNCPNINVILPNNDGQTAWDVAKPRIREQFPQLKP